MKKYCAWGVYIGLVSGCLFGAENVSIVERGPHHRINERIKQETQADGSTVEQRTRTVELATGMHYREGEAWLETRELIEPHANGAIAHYGPHKAAFSANLNTWGAIQLVDPDGLQFTTHVLGLAYTDTASGQSVMIAEVKDSIGQIVGQNQIVYSDAFVDVTADVRSTYTRGGFEQDIIIREAIPSPQVYGLDPTTTRLEVFTEFVAAPPANVQQRLLSSETDPARRQGMALPDFVDEELNFGALKIGEGKAVDFQGVVTDELPVGKTYEMREGRRFLVEAVALPQIQPALNALPARQANNGGAARVARIAKAMGKSILRPFPNAPKQQAAAERKPMKQLASMTLNPGVLLDYVFTFSTGVTNFVFRPEYTYSITGTLNLSGTNTIVGGAVIKFARGAALSFNGGAIVCDTTPYHPAVFTAADDTSIGDSVTAGSLTGYFANGALKASSNVVGELHDLRFIHAAVGIDWNGSQERFYNLQFINCSNAIRRVNATNAPVHNVLATNVLYVFIGSNSTFNAQHVTARVGGTLATLSGTPSKLTLTNSILLNVTNAGTGTIQLDYVATNGTTSLPAASHGATVSSSDFHSSVGGYHYLGTNSSLIDAGTTVIDATLLAELRSLTTMAPVLLNTTAQVSVTLSPLAWRDNDTPDLGYHYAPLDYVFRGYWLNTNVVLTMTNGVAVGIDFNGQSWGLIFDRATNICIGSPTNMNRIVRAHNAQERSTGNPGTRAMIYDIGSSGTHGDSDARYRFTEFAGMASDGFALYTGMNWKNWEWSHSWIYNLSISFNANKGSQTIGVTNCLFERADFTAQRSGTSSAFHFRNNLFRQHNLNIADLNSSSSIRDNLFDTGLIHTNGTTVAHSHNAFFAMTNNGVNYATNALPGITGNLPLSSLAYQSDPYSRFGSYGRYYQPSGSLLIHAGSQNATNAGLYHFTTTTNQVKETNTVVDIGLHYVALNINGHPQDFDDDGVPDYYEDSNGNGSNESGELNWLNEHTDGDGVEDGVELLQGRNPFGGVLPDTSNLLNLRVFTPLK